MISWSLGWAWQNQYVLKNVDVHKNENGPKNKDGLINTKDHKNWENLKIKNYPQYEDLFRIEYNPKT